MQNLAHAHHEAAVQLAVERYSTVDGILAIVLIGSLARGDERADSDVDLYLILSEEAYEARPRGERAGFWDADAVEGVAGFDVKVGTISKLRSAVDRASDEMRACFDDARVIWSLDAEAGDEIADLARRINSPGDDYWARHQESFLARAMIDGYYFVSEGLDLDRRLATYHGAVHFAFALGRAVLALNHVLYRGPKYLELQLADAERAPRDFVRRLREFVAAPTVEVVGELGAETRALADWPFAEEDWLTVYLEDNELAWLTGVMPPEFR